MTDQKLLNKAITISAKEEKIQGGQPVVKLKDEKGLTFTVYKLKQDGTESVAWKQLAELSVGNTVQIGYVEDLGEYEGKTVTYRTIRNFNSDIGEGMANAASQPESPRSGANSASGGQAVDWDKLGYLKTLSLWAQGYSDTEGFIHDLENGLLWKKFQAIQAEADKRFSQLRQAVAAVAPELVEPLPEELPTIQIGEEYPDPADIPF
jgi:hypothetical protein